LPEPIEVQSREDVGEVMAFHSGIVGGMSTNAQL
jgi:hypothetical protein